MYNGSGTYFRVKCSFKWLCRIAQIWLLKSDMSQWVCARTDNFHGVDWGKEGLLRAIQKITAKRISEVILAFRSFFKGIDCYILRFVIVALHRTYWEEQIYGRVFLVLCEIVRWAKENSWVHSKMFFVRISFCVNFHSRLRKNNTCRDFIG